MSQSFENEDKNKVSKGLMIGPAASKGKSGLDSLD